MFDKAFLKEYLLKPFCYAVVIVLSLLILSKVTALNFSLASNSEKSSFAVVGTGKVTVTPTIATTTFTVQEKGDTQEQAKNAANDKQNQAIQILTSLGIKKGDIKTTSFTVTQNYEDSTVPNAQPMLYPRPQTVQKGYIATATTQVKAEKVDQLNQAIDKITALGINVGGVEYTLADQETYKAQAVRMAVEDAKKKAQELSKAAGFRLGKIVTIQDLDQQNGIIQPMAFSAKTGATENSDTSTNLEPGSNEVTSRISITYSIKN